MINRAQRTISLCLVVFELAACEKFNLDDRMEALCANDGGASLVETVLLPRTLFDRNGLLIVQLPMPGPEGWTFERVGDDLYRIERRHDDIEPGAPFDRLYSKPRLRKYVVRVVRTADRKILGWSTVYIRTGGELTPFGTPSSKQCPPVMPDIVNAVFKKEL